MKARGISFRNIIPTSVRDNVSPHEHLIRYARGSIIPPLCKTLTANRTLHMAAADLRTALGPGAPTSHFAWL